VTGVVYFIFEHASIWYFIAIPRAEIREIQARKNELLIFTATPEPRHDIPYTPGQHGDNEEQAITDALSVGSSAWNWQDGPLSSDFDPPQAHEPTTGPMSTRNRMIEALTQAIDTDVTFRWNGSTWDVEESRPA